MLVTRLPLSILSVLPALKHSTITGPFEASKKHLMKWLRDQYRQINLTPTCNLMLGMSLGEKGFTIKFIDGDLTWEMGTYKQVRCITTSTHQQITSGNILTQKQIINKIKWLFLCVSMSVISFNKIVNKLPYTKVQNDFFPLKF